MGVEVVVPAAAWDDQSRVAARGWVTRWWQVRGFRVTVAGLTERPWRKGAAVNAAIRSSPADVIVVADSDCFVSTASVERMVSEAAAGAWVAPFSRVKRLTVDATDALLGCDPAAVESPPIQALERAAHPVLPGGGIVAAHRDVWALVGGFDPRFADWGGEDYALGCALRTMTGQRAITHGGDLWHLWHTPQPNVRDESPETSRLSWRYRKAKFQRDVMTDLLAEWR